jgi:hypothetical protein
MRIPENAVLQGPPQGPEPIRTDNFRPATITASTNGSIQEPPSIIPLVFGAGMALFIIYNARNAGFGNFTFNFR